MFGFDHAASLLNPRAGQLFFEPVGFHLQLPDLRIQILLPPVPLNPVFDLRRRLREDLRQPLGHFFLPLAHLHRMHLVSLRDHLHRLDPFEGFQPTFALNSALNERLFLDMLNSFLG